MAKQSQKALSKLRADYIDRRKASLSKSVDELQVKLYEAIVDKSLSALEIKDGKIINNADNRKIIQSLDKLYRDFTRKNSAKVISQWIKDLKGIGKLNESYFKNISEKGVVTGVFRANEAVNKTLGLTINNKVVKGGFIDKFLKDRSVIKDIKKETIKAITKGASIQDFQRDMKSMIQGVPELERSGKIQNYFQTYAYDTYQKVDRINGDKFAQELGLRYAYYQGPLKSSSRAICIHSQGKIVDMDEFSKLSYSEIKESFREGLPKEWNPKLDIGGYNCEHLWDWIPDELADIRKDRLLAIGSLKKT